MFQEYVSVFQPQTDIVFNRTLITKLREKDQVLNMNILNLLMKENSIKMFQC